MSKEAAEAQTALAPAQITLTADEASFLSSLFDMMQRPDVQTVRASARLAAAILADARSRAAPRA